MTKLVNKKKTSVNRILNSAIELFSEKGFSGTTTKQIAEKACVNEALIFRYFSNKSKLYTAIIREKINQEPKIEMPLELLRHTRDDYKIFSSIAENIFLKCKNDPTLIRLLYFSALEGHELSDIFLDNYVVFLRKQLSDYIESRIKDGDFKDINPHICARAFLGMVSNYIISEQLFFHDHGMANNHGEVINTFTTLFMNGIKKGSHK